MKLVATSDCHGKLAQATLPEGDVLIIAGDLLPNRFASPELDATFQLNALKDVDDYCGSLGFDHILLIAGNHDWVFERYPEAYRSLSHMTYLQDNGVTIGGLRFYGSPHQPEFFNWAFNLRRGGRDLEHYWSLIPEDTDVLITHGPPFGILDRPFGGNDHAGCELLADRIKVIRPKVHVFGHIHGSYGMLKLGATIFANACLCNEEYRPVNQPHVIEV